MCKTPEQPGSQLETHESNPQTLDPKRLEPTKSATLHVLSEEPQEIPGYSRKTLNVIEHPNGVVILSKNKPDAEHYGYGGKLPEDDYPVRKEAEALEARALEANSKDDGEGKADTD